jgi:hypothetical protein
MKTMRLTVAGSTRRWNSNQRARRRATSGRSCSLAKIVFFERLAAAPQEPPQRVAAHRDPALLAQHRQQRVERNLLAALYPRHQPLALAFQQRAQVTTHLARSNRTRRAPCLRPANPGCRAHLQLPRRRPR